MVHSKNGSHERYLARVRVPWISILYVAIFHCAILSIFPLYQREFPKALTYYVPDTAAIFAMLLICAGHAALLATCALLCQRISTKFGLGMFLCLAGIQALGVTVDVSYYVAYGSYPGLQLWLNFFYAPLTVLGYAQVASSQTETLFLAASLFLAVILGLRMWQEVKKSSISVCLALGIGLQLVSYLAFLGSNPAGYRFVAREHSLPIVRWYGSLVQPKGNSLDEIASYLPRVHKGDPGTLEKRVSNVVVVMVECLRPDHLSFLGYSRSTTPELEKHRDNLVVMTRGYAHGPSTESSFPVTFTSRYLPYEAVPDVSIWRLLTRQGIRNAFISSGQMRWGYLDKVIGLPEVETLFTASQATSAERTEFSSDPMDYSVDDRTAFSHYLNFMNSLGPNDPSFSVLHLDATHYPYQEPEELQIFSPTLGDRDKGRSLGEVRGAMHDPKLRERLMNSYDNALRFVDKIIGDLFRELERRGRLDDTVVIITGDHGEAFGEHSSGFHGTTLYEEQVRVPIILRFPDKMRAYAENIRRHENSPRGLIDIVPTAFELLGAQSDFSFQGYSLLNPSPKPFEILAYSGFGRKVAIIKGTRKYIFDCLSLEGFEFDLETDPEELKNLWTQEHKSLAEFLKAVFIGS